MKKDNKKQAQARRAKERAAQAKAKSMKKWMGIVLPIAAVVILMALILIPSGNGSKELNTDTNLLVEDGDTVNIDYVGTIDGVEFSGGSTGGRGTDLEIGSGNYIPGFEEQLIGHAPGETVEVVVTFPEEYPAQDVAGKEAVFMTVINGIYK